MFVDVVDGVNCDSWQDTPPKVLHSQTTDDIKSAVHWSHLEPLSTNPVGNLRSFVGVVVTVVVDTLGVWGRCLRFCKRC